MSQRFSIDVDGMNIAGEIYYPHKIEGLHPALCLCHGIPASRPDPTDRGYPLLAERFAAEGFITCIFNFRGCGESEGNLDLLGWTFDLDGVLTHLSQIENVDKSRLSLMGFSGGAAASAYVAARDLRISSLILCASPAEFSLFSAPERVGEFITQCRTVGTFRDADFPPSVQEWLDHFQQVSPIYFIDRVSPRPLLIIHGSQDELIDPSQAQQLYAKAKEPKELAIIPGAEHRIKGSQAAMDKAVNWLKQINNLDG
ncbi:MAG: alpha/beta fold hydrolase [Chloroflexota bacterium]|nr:alpha/beta fold hydrolase [Chloroflexota bacterium]